ncbi:hypothetical protein E6P09_03270 [Haloferax mediterranei ATCC 33500]|uniref:Uncharacterized protein n=1 Tax=Haloferax mediterranei (strain ATCC 33500 / DSM 1411 / JCM 8866 / NBRC 14739 / NCIMB 2177 / R-4) TaxID=523841 RepID=I3R0L8_HALMT|nr:hypothetical protein [Haloferax mediterranei]AFK17778.2 hypothetical protein HFX_0034 [Haloferax mediterranei ATCC 33500]AHZ22791.1 hypothetical protein BM92_09115 [Haloferax mediterranei ATCC 33500]EMA02950.1 hypothetical protein C439_10215 [Haloferax mediterranei ATCC 33500]MDX5987868.1 hypothetical protein [Haloferax mediterranei ATCC 33500]QCQ74344.1 hypothetical protein E6P09_03270 [Haloferax mediterranei ATCC 33500]
MRTNRGGVDVEDLLKIVLVLVVVWLVLEIIGEVFGLFSALIGLGLPLFGLVAAALIVLWFLDWI